MSNDFVYEPDTEIADWNTALTVRNIKLLNADGIYTVEQILDVQASEWVNKTKGAGSQTMDQIAATQEMIKRRLTKQGVRLLDRQTKAASAATETITQDQFDTAAARVAIARASLIDLARDAASSISTAISMAASAEDDADARQYFGVALARLRDLEAELDNDALPECVPNNELVRSVIERFDTEMSIDAVAAYDQAHMAVDAITGDGWIVVRADSVRG